MADVQGTRKRNYSATAIETTLVNSITSAATGDTTTSVAVVSVSGFPSAPFTLILGPDTNKEEVVTVTAVVGTTLTITRGQDGTQAQSHAAGSSVRHGVSAREFKEASTHMAARGYDVDSAILSNADLSHVHGIATGDGVVVGTDKAQSLTNKSSITGLVSTGLVSSSATPKSYVDSILGSATAASTSATSAATSATSAATSASSAATSASSALTSANSAATSAASALTSQNAASTSAASASTSAASSLVSQNAAATSAASASTSASSALTSANAASTSAASASTSAASALTSQTAAATSASSAQTSATSAAASYSSTIGVIGAGVLRDLGSIVDTDTTSTTYLNIATVANAAQTSATSAATSATSAATSASSALTSQTAAATSATSAATSATSAAASATAAATSATSAAASATAAAAFTPSQTGNSGKYLTTDGTSTSWGAVNALPSQSGNSGKYLTTNGSAASWAAITTDPLPQIMLMMGA